MSGDVAAETLPAVHAAAVGIPIVEHDRRRGDGPAVGGTPDEGHRQQVPNTPANCTSVLRSDRTAPLGPEDAAGRSVLAVLPPLGAGDDVLGYVRRRIGDSAVAMSVMVSVGGITTSGRSWVADDVVDREFLPLTVSSWPHHRRSSFRPTVTILFRGDGGCPQESCRIDKSVPPSCGRAGLAHRMARPDWIAV
jgi:hypothetical protein